METDTMEYIETYFQHTMADSERMQFEERIATDKDFADEVAFYIATREAVRQQLLQQKQKDWGADNVKDELTQSDELIQPIVPVRKIGVSKWWSYVAAACLLLFAAFYLFEKKNTSPQQLANNYVETELAHISLKMSGGGDSLQMGKDAYNEKNYDKALQYFTGFEKAHPENNVAKKMTGIVYLVTQEYDKALQQFGELANVKGLYSNPGLFYKAITLIQRNKDGDLQQAKELLKQVVKKDLGKSNEAAEWLKKF